MKSNVKIIAKCNGDNTAQVFIDDKPLDLVESIHISITAMGTHATITVLNPEIDIECPAKFYEKKV